MNANETTSAPSNTSAWKLVPNLDWMLPRDEIELYLVHLRTIQIPLCLVTQQALRNFIRIEGMKRDHNHTYRPRAIFLAKQALSNHELNVELSDSFNRDYWAAAAC
ncbi:MAG: hypothetical protein WC477_00845 [Patescibacteria group bacterium]